MLMFFNENGNFINRKTIFSYEKNQYINKWITTYKNKSENTIGFLAGVNGNDFQRNIIVYILNQREQMANPRGIWITKENIFQASIYFAVRKCIKATWLNDRDQFLYPNDNWKTDIEFQNDCFTYTLFNNNISSKHGTNYWIPFTEYEVNSREKFESDFMTKFIKGKLKPTGNGNLLEQEKVRTTELEFSTEAKAVFDAGRELWKYYHNNFADNFVFNFAKVSNFGKVENPKVEKYNVNASLYDIKEYFQQRTVSGRMNSKSSDEIYTKLIADLRDKLDILAQKIEPKVYEYEFLKR